jgi:hypothetical protein
MDSEEVSPRRQQERMKWLLQKEQQQETLQALDQGLQSVQPYLRKAYLRMRLRNASLIPGLLESYSIEHLADKIADIFEATASPEEEKIQLLADMLIHILYPDNIISMALPEIKKAYNVILRSAGGWSSRKSNPDKRREAALNWFRRNRDRFSYLKETYLEDPALYNVGGGQEKRNFINRLMIKIVNAEIGKELTFQKVDESIKELKKQMGQSLRLEDL